MPLQDAPYLIVGLGNPGPRYARTRHNAGFMAVDELARRHGLRFAGGQARAEVARGTLQGVRVILAKPQTYMNESGRAVQGLAHFYKVPKERVLVVYDDFALPLGTLRLREKGSAGGHNGLESTIRHLGTQGFPRLRIGVGGPPGGRDSHIDWVLGRFTKDEQPLVDEIIARAADAVESVYKIGVERTMNLYNTRGEVGDGAPSSESDKRSAVGSRQSADSPDAPPASPNPSPPDTWITRARRIIRGEKESAE